MDKSGLPASRIDALSIVGFGLVTSLLEGTPAQGVTYSIVLTGSANIYAIGATVLTLRDIFLDDSVERHLRLFILGLLVMTITTSTLSLLSLLSTVGESKVFRPAFATAGLVVITATLGFGLAELYLMYSIGCDDPQFKSIAVCNHSSGYVRTAVIVAGLLAVVVSIAIMAVRDNSDGVLIGVIDWFCWGDKGNKGDLPLPLVTPRAAGNGEYSRTDDSVENSRATDTVAAPIGGHHSHSDVVAVLSRSSAFVKVCLMGVYWFLVDADLSWDTFNGHDASWWMTGQWFKQSVAILNHFIK